MHDAKMGSKFDLGQRVRIALAGNGNGWRASIPPEYLRHDGKIGYVTDISSEACDDGHHNGNHVCHEVLICREGHKVRLPEEALSPARRQPFVM